MYPYICIERDFEGNIFSEELKREIATIKQSC